MINFKFVNVVWGAAFTDTFVNVTLPSELSAGNLEFVAANSQSSYRIYTTPKDAETIFKSPAGRRLEKLMNIEVGYLEDDLPVDDPGSSSTSPMKHSLMGACHNNFIETAGNDGAAMVFLSPDVIWGDGSFRRLFEIAQSGKRSVMMCGLRLEKESFLLSLQHYMKDGVLQPISKRDLVRLAMNHLHPESESLVWDSEIANTLPSLLLWKIPGGLIVRAFHLHPLMVHPVIRNVIPFGTIDDDYSANACPDPADEYIVQDSDDIVVFELSRQLAGAQNILHSRELAGAENILHSMRVANSADRFARIGAPFKYTQAVVFASNRATLKHIQYLQKRICIHSTELSESWQEVEERSNVVVREILSLIEQNSAPTP